MARMQPEAEYQVYEIKVALVGTKPPIWRQFQIRDDSTLANLHDYLQVVMGWTNSHLHHFTEGGESYGPPEPEFPRRQDGRKVRVGDLLHKPGDHLIYEYDFGDGWEHEIVLEQVLSPNPGATYPVVIAGDRACPPENSGGTPGYEQLLKVLKDPRDREHQAMLRWVGKDFDPEAFDVEAANRALRGARRARSRSS